MAVEVRRGCGYRKVGGIYLIGGELMEPCGRLPWPLMSCPCCGAGVKQSRSWTWVNPARLLSPVTFGEKDDQPVYPNACTPTCVKAGRCALNDPLAILGERSGLLWIGEAYYKTPFHFSEEAARMGISRRLSAVPREFKLGETWVLLAHPRAGLLRSAEGEVKECPGVFSVFRPTRIEQIVTQSQSEDPEFMEGLEKRGITVVVVPDNDPDHNPKAKDPDPGDDLLKNVG